MKQIQGGVTAAKGYQATGVEVGFKYANRKDYSLVYSEKPARVAGTFTTNVVKAAPVKWDMNIVKYREYAQAICLNSGIANACTSKEGEEINELMASGVAKALNIPIQSVLTASTGVIGQQLPKDKVLIAGEKAASQLSSELAGGTLAAEAIMTTDTISKQCAVTFDIQGTTVTLGGMSKGSGMIHPNMATMLAVLTSDVAISKELLQEALSEDVKDTFNMISVDRDTSTNDTLVVFANGMAGNVEITEKNDDYKTFCEALHFVNRTLAKLMAGDGEGATKLLEVTVQHAATTEEARTLSKSVITSNLVKTAVYGSDANWGRIICALGYSGVEFDPEIVDLSIESEAGTVKLYEQGKGTDFSEELATKILSAKEVTAIVDMNMGECSATAWGCDLTYDYVKINGDYRS